MEDVLLDVWAHRFADDPKLRDEDVSDDFEGDVESWEEDEGIPAEPAESRCDSRALGGSRGAGGSVAEAPPDPGDFDQIEADDRL